VRVQGLGPDSALVVDGEAVEDAGGQRPIRLPPGRHQVLVRRVDGPDWGRTLELAAGASVTVIPEVASAPLAKKTPRAETPVLAVEPVPATQAGNERPVYRRWWFWTAVVAVAAAGGGAYALWGRHNDDCLRTNNCIVVGQ
jgi:hypothetical protein